MCLELEDATLGEGTICHEWGLGTSTICFTTENRPLADRTPVRLVSSGNEACFPLRLKKHFGKRSFASRHEASFVDSFGT